MSSSAMESTRSLVPRPRMTSDTQTQCTPARWAMSFLSPRMRCLRIFFRRFSLSSMSIFNFFIYFCLYKLYIGSLHKFKRDISYTQEKT